jgi:hypothetical protein
MGIAVCIKKLIVFVLLASSFSIGWQFYRSQCETVRLQEEGEKFGVTSRKLRPYEDELSRLCIELFLIGVFVSSRLRGLKGSLLTAIILSWVTSVYVSWWQCYFRLDAVYRSENRVVPQIAYLYNANFLDICVAASIALIITIQILHSLLETCPRIE